MKMAVRVVSPDDYHALAEFLAYSRRFSEKEEDEACCPLPFMLQDLCLLVVVNDINSYPIELLASLPRWFRSRLLAALPALQLFGLESSPIAEGVDVEEIWKARANHGRPGVTGMPSTLSHGLHHVSLPRATKKPSFQLDIGNASGKLSYESHFSIPYAFLGPAMNLLANEIKAALKIVEESESSTINAYLLEIASDILSNKYTIEPKALAHKLISIPGDVLLSNLLSGSLHQPCENSLCSQGVWKKQATALVINQTGTYRYSRSGRVSNVQLTPCNLLHLCDKQDPAELLYNLAKRGNLQLSSANVHVEAISESILKSLHADQLIEDCGGHLPSDDVKYMSIMNHFLREVVLLRLQCDKYVNIGIMICLINVATVNGQESRLKHLFCTLPDMYMDVVQPFSALFALLNFSQLTLEVSDVYPLALCKVLQAFMTAPCPQAQKLQIIAKKGIRFPTPLKASQLASFNLAPDTPPPCSVQHKTLEFSSQKEFTNALYLILQFPTIRLKEIALVNLGEFPQYLHFCAIHTDLQAAKLVIDLRGMPSSLATTENDLISLIKLPLLEEVHISGAWGNRTDVKRGIASALKGRSQNKLSPLKKLYLQLHTAQYYKKRDFQMLCDAIFSLVELENLDIVFGKGFVDMIQHAFADVLYRSWLEHSQKVKLKSITMQGFKAKFEKVALIAQELSFSEPSRYLPRADYSYDYPDSDDEYFGYSNSYGYGDYYDSDDLF